MRESSKILIRAEIPAQILEHNNDGNAHADIRVDKLDKAFITGTGGGHRLVKDVSFAIDGDTVTATQYYVDPADSSEMNASQVMPLATEQNAGLMPMESVAAIAANAAEITQEADRAIHAEDLIRDDLDAANGILSGVHTASLTGALLSRVLSGVTNVSQSLFPPDMPWAAGKTLVYDTNGTEGVISGTDGGDFVINTASISPLGADEPTLLGNVATYADLPATVADAETLFGRTPDADDYARVIADETTGGHTVEYYITDVTDGNISWGNPVVINTSDYQEQSDAGMSGKLLTGGATAGTYGTAVDPATFATAEDAGAKLDKTFITGTGGGHL